VKGEVDEADAGREVEKVYGKGDERTSSQAEDKRGDGEEEEGDRDVE
jgi:hypothetical protein